MLRKIELKQLVVKQIDRKLISYFDQLNNCLCQTFTGRFINEYFLNFFVYYYKLNIIEF